MGEVVILLGSNIDPADNIRRGARHLAAKLPVLRASSVWFTPAAGAPGPSFYNAAVLCSTEMDADALKYNLLRPIEEQLGRIRTHEKYAARTMDIDTIILNGEVIEPRLWNTAFILLPTAELVPDLRHPKSGKSLQTLGKEIEPASGAYRIQDFPLFFK